MLNPTSTNNINIEIAFATAEKQIIIALCIPNNITIHEVISITNIAAQFPELDVSDIDKLHIGIFGKKIDPKSYALKDCDRIEIYRPLNKTPNQKRLERAKTNAKK